MRRLVTASIIGVVVTLLLLAGSFAADTAGHSSLARALFWHNGLLQSATPLHNIGTPEQPVYEGTPLHFVVFVLSVPVGFLIYGVAAYVALGLLRRGT